MTNAEQLSLTHFLNAFFRENVVDITDSNHGYLLNYVLEPFGFKLQLTLQYYSLTCRHQYHFPATVFIDNKRHELHPWCLVGLLIQDLSARHPKASANHLEFMQRFFNSCENMQIILDKLTRADIDALFIPSVNFELAEGGLISGHQFHPAPKSREGFTKSDFFNFSPEIYAKFQLHYFLADAAIVYTMSDLPYDANALVRQHCLTEELQGEGRLIPLHPWQASYIQGLPQVQALLQSQQLKYMGPLGKYFSATTSVRTVYAENCDFMLKLSLNVAITNSVRMQYGKELTRGIAAHRFWNSEVGKDFNVRFPQFLAITDPAFVCLKHNDHLIQETAVLFRNNPFISSDNNVTPIASLCQDHPFDSTNRFTHLIPLVASLNQCSKAEAALRWFTQFLKVAIEPLLWLFVNEGIALEAHQQNLLLDIHQGMPIKSYYRDNQGYYVIDKAVARLSMRINEDILNEFCQGTREFICHHFIYYLITNSVFGIINAIGTARMIDEARLIKALADFINQKHHEWEMSNYLLPRLLKERTLPFKGNLLTRFYQLDELTSPLEQQSIYLNVNNLIYQAHAMSCIAE